MKRLIVSSLSVLLLEAVSVLALSAQAIAQTSAPGGVRSTGNVLNYPYGTRIYRGGEIDTPSGRVIYPAVRTNNGDGTTTYYYQDGTSVTTKPNTINPTGSLLSPGSLNGGLRNHQ